MADDEHRARIAVAAVGPGSRSRLRLATSLSGAEAAVGLEGQAQCGGGLLAAPRRGLARMRNFLEARCSRPAPICTACFSPRAG